MRTTKELAALVEAAPDWDHQVDIRQARGSVWIAEVETVGPVPDQKADALAKLLGALDRATLRHLIANADEADEMRAVLAEIAEIGCEYGDDCPTFGTRHGQCVPCKARRGCAEEVGRG